MAWGAPVRSPRSATAACPRTQRAASVITTRGGKRGSVLARSGAAAASGNFDKKVADWLRWDQDPASRSVIENLVADGDQAKLQELLGTRLEFGTAGLRGLLGPGTARMNEVVVQQTAQGLCRYLQSYCPKHLLEGGIVIGYDGRHGSLAFARITARVFLVAGVRVSMFGRMVPTPFVAAGVAELRAAAGVMVTASHNPKEYNGYKVYLGNGCQIIPPHDAGIAAAIEANLEPWQLLSWDAASASPRLADPYKYVADCYFDRLLSLKSLPAAGPAREAALAALGTPPPVYTPLHGVGAEPLLRAFQVMGLPEPYIVPDQRDPDPEFPTVTFPNPEEGKGTWSRAFQTGEERGARLVLANDPDADRLAVAERDPASPGGWRVFSGNEIGALLAHWVWAHWREKHPKAPPSTCVMLASAVSSKMLRAMAAKEGFRFVETLTGFKWLGSTALELEEREGATVLFAFEEAIGFMLGGMYKDKDGISAAAAFTELAAATYGSGGTLDGLLQQLYARYGYFEYRAGYFITDAAKSRAVFAHLRASGGGGGGGVAGGGASGAGGGAAVYAGSIGGLAVTHVRDLGTGLDTSQPGGRAVLPCQPGDMMVTFGLEGGASLTLRASGTEPKLKYYLEVTGADAGAARLLAERLVASVDALVAAEEQGLRRPASA